MGHLQFCKTHIKKVLAFAGVVAGCYLFFATVFVFVALAMDGRRGAVLPPIDTPPGQHENNGANENGWVPLPGTPTLPADQGSLLRPPARSNFILMGIDHNALADAIMVGTFYRDTGDIHLMSVPRDTHIHLSDVRHAQIRAMGLNIPQQLRLNMFRSYAGRALGPQLIREEVGTMFGVHFHFYVEVNLAAFRRIVDNVLGGVYFNVPRHLFYEDPAQNLVIDVPAGFRRLTGEQAEGVVRYRGFADADLGRTRVQMDFMTELIQQVATREALVANPVELVSILINEVYTNFAPTEVVRFAPYIPPLGSLGEIRTFVMPGASGYRAGRSVFIPNGNQLHIVADQVFRAHIDIEDIPEDTPEDTMDD